MSNDTQSTRRTSIEYLYSTRPLSSPTRLTAWSRLGHNEMTQDGSRPLTQQTLFVDLPVSKPTAALTATTTTPSARELIARRTLRYRRHTCGETHWRRQQLGLGNCQTSARTDETKSRKTGAARGRCINAAKSNGDGPKEKRRFLKDTAPRYAMLLPNHLLGIFGRLSADAQTGLHNAKRLYRLDDDAAVGAKRNPNPSEKCR